MSNSWHRATASIYLIVLICEVPCEVSRHSHRKQVTCRVLFSFSFKLMLPFKATPLSYPDTSRCSQSLSPAHMSRKCVPQRKWPGRGTMGTHHDYRTCPMMSLSKKLQEEQLLANRQETRNEGLYGSLLKVEFWWTIQKSKDTWIEPLKSII